MANTKFYKKPLIQQFTLEGVNHVSVKDAFTLMQTGEYYLLDVRPESQGRQAHFEFQNVFNMPLHKLPEKTEYIPKETPIICVCNSGIDSTKAANFFNRQGFKTVANMDGGLIEWKNQSLPVVETTYNAPTPHTPCAGGCTGCS